jgi:hypothetical protein
MKEDEWIKRHSKKRMQWKKMKEMEEGDCKKKEIRCYQDFVSFQVLQANLFCLACTLDRSFWG